MPGHYSKPKGVTILGAGYGGYYGDVLWPDMADKVAREYTNGLVGGNAWNVSIPVWEDRDVKNRGTKLNP
jgi:hypothetical protein